MINPILHGSLSYFGLAPVLRLIQATRATGCLEIERGDERTELFIEDGRWLFARTTGVAPRIGDLLVRRGDLRPEAVEFALAIQQDAPEERLGRMLVDNGVLSAEQVHSAVLEVQRHIVLTALRWRSGTFRFGSEARLGGEDIRLELDVDELLTWAVTAADSPLERFPDARAA